MNKMRNVTYSDIDPRSKRFLSYFNDSSYHMRFVGDLDLNKKHGTNNLITPADNGQWIIVKVLKRDKAGKPLRWLGKWKSNNKEPVNGFN